MVIAAERLLEPPPGTFGRHYRTLAYLDGVDEVTATPHAFIAYLETVHGCGRWSIYIRSLNTGGAYFDPETIRAKARLAARAGAKSFAWGYRQLPDEDDCRQIEFLVHLDGAQPREVELLMRLRRRDGSPAPAQSVRFAWPS